MVPTIAISTDLYYFMDDQCFKDFTKTLIGRVPARRGERTHVPIPDSEWSTGVAASVSIKCSLVLEGHVT